MKKKRGFVFLQKLSRAFLVPMALIAAAGLLLSISSIFRQSSVVSALPFLGTAGFVYFFKVLGLIGGIFINNLPIIYAICLSFALSSDDKEYAGFAGFVGYLALISSMGLVLGSNESVVALFHPKELGSVLGIDTVLIGMLGGIFVGLITPIIHRKFRTIKLPTAFAFFQGVRFVPFVTVVIFVAFGQLVPFAWIPLSKAIEGLAGVIDNLGSFGVFLYASIERLLIPTGLHGVFNNIIKRTAASGTWIMADGTTIDGALSAFQYFQSSNSLPTNLPFDVMFKFMRGIQIPMTVFAIPAIAFAMFKTANEDKKKLVKPLFIAATFSALFAGITEPIEFLFLFSAPLLYVIYSVITGLAGMAVYMLGVRIGGTEANIFGLIVEGAFKSYSNWLIIIPIGIVTGLVCYFLFKWYILKFDVKLPGRGGDYDDSIALAAEIANVSLDYSEGNSEFKTTDPKVLKAQLIIKGLGGAENIKEVDSCMSRLRVIIVDMTKVDESILKTTGCSGIVKPDDENIQVIYGPAVGGIKNAINKLLEKKK